MNNGSKVLDYKNGIATFIMSHYLKDNDISKKHLDEALENIFNQTDTNWQLFIIDDQSPCKAAVDYLDQVKQRNPDKIQVIKKDTNNGPGYCRNIAIKMAYQQKSPFLIYNDADDISDVRRLEVTRKIFMDDPEADVIYSTFKVIDENSNLVPTEKLTESIVEILEGHMGNPPQGINAWIDIGTQKGYTNLTSATSVKTELAYKYPFPTERVSEDSNAWMRYSAGGGKFVYTGETPSLYRIPQNTAGSSSRSREGGKEGFYMTKARVDTDGFTRALEIGLTNGKIKVEQRDELLIRFYLKLGETLYREEQQKLADREATEAMLIDKEITKRVIQEKKYNWVKI